MGAQKMGTAQRLIAEMLWLYPAKYNLKCYALITKY